MIEGIAARGRKPKALATCDGADCNAHQEVGCVYVGPTAKTKPNEKQVRAKLLGSGWSYVKGKLFCPSCEENRKVVPMKVVEKQDGPREPTRSEKRQIMDMLETTYDVDAERYSGGDTDETVAEILKVMPGWVSQIREEFFGPAGSNEDISQLIADIDQFKEVSVKCLNEFVEAGERLRKVMAEATAHKARLERIEKAVGPRVMKRA